jgi:hypothetical protein
MQPFQVSGQNAPAQKGNVDWLTAPRATLSPRVLSSLIPLDELWVKDDDDDDWVTIQVVADDVVIFGEDRHRNLFADQFDPADTRKKVPTDPENSLSGMHPFTELCANPVDDYFWGLSEVQAIALLQTQLNRSVDGINSLMRIQEDPPRMIKGAQSITQQIYSAGRKPGGYLTDSSPTVDIKSFGQELPETAFTWLHETERMFDTMAGTPPVLRGRGESGIRSGVHAQTATQNASPRFMDRALRLERQCSEAGKIAYLILQTKMTDELVAWVPGDNTNIETLAIPADAEALEPPAPGMKPVAFTLNQLPNYWRVSVDSHSGSPAFAHMAQLQAFDLAKAGAMGPADLIAAVHPAHEDRLIQEVEAKQMAEAELIKQHPELLSHGKKK